MLLSIQEVQFLSTSVLQLKAVQQKFSCSKEMLSKLVPENDGELHFKVAVDVQACFFTG